MHLRSVLLYIFFLTPFLFSQQIILKGTVTDSSTGSPVSGAFIAIDDNYYFTNYEGHYKISLFKHGVYNIKSGHIGYKSSERTISAENETLAEINLSLVPSLIEMDEVYVTSNRKERLLKSSPASESLVASEQIEVKPFNSLADAVKNEAGISLSRDGIWGTELTIRGMSRQNVVTLIDGARIETSTEQAARFSLVDMSSIDRVEIVKGAASSTYGTGATGGIVNIVSKTPRFSEALFIGGGVTYGTGTSNKLNSWSASFNSAGSFWGAAINGSYRKAGEMETPRGIIKNSRFTDYNFSGAIDIAPSSGHLFSAKYQQFKAEDVGIPGGSSSFTNTSDVRYPVEQRKLMSLNYQIIDLTNIVKRIKLNTAKQYILRDVEVIPYTIQNIAKTATSPAKRISVLKTTPGADHNFNSLRMDADLVLFEGNILNAGVDYWMREYEGWRQKYQKIETLDTLNSVTSTTYKTIGEKPLPNSIFRSIGVYVQDDFAAIKNKLNFSFGGRVDFINIKGDKTYNPEYEITNGVYNANPAGRKLNWDGAQSDDVSYSANIGAVYSVTGEISLTLNLGYSFRSPSLEERFQFIDLGNLVKLGNPYLEPEKGLFADAGVRYYSSDLKVITSFFYNNIIDYVVEVPSAYEGRPARVKQNAGKARLYGFDISADYNFYDGLVAFSSFSLVNGEDLETSQYLPQIPPVNGMIGIGYKNEQIFNADINADFSGWQKKVASGEITTPGYTVFNLSVSSPAYKFYGSSVRIYAGAENIFDKAYRNHLSTARGSVTIEPGRNFYIKTAVNF